MFNVLLFQSWQALSVQSEEMVLSFRSFPLHPKTLLAIKFLGTPCPGQLAWFQVFPAGTVHVVLATATADTVRRTRHRLAPFS